MCTNIMFDLITFEWNDGYYIIIQSVRVKNKEINYIHTFRVSYINLIKII